MSAHSPWNLERWVTLRSLQTISQDPDDSGPSTSHYSTTGILLQDCAPEVLLAADILASRVSKPSFNSVPAKTKSASQDRNPFLSREGNVPKISKPQEAWHSHKLNPNRQDKQLTGMSPDQV